MVKQRKNRLLSGSEVLGIVCLFSMILTLVLIPVANQFSENKSLRARQKAQVLAYQVFQIFKEANKEGKQLDEGRFSLDRRPASDSSPTPDFKYSGIIGLDPWGTPYNYRIYRTNQSLTKVVVWSLGTNKTQDLSEEQIESAPAYVGSLDQSDDIRVSFSLDLGQD